MALLLLLLCSLATVILGLTGYVIFGPLTYRHLMDRRTTVGSTSFGPTFLRWLLRGGYRAQHDPNLTGLAIPARIMASIILTGVAGCVVWAVIKAFA